MSEPTLDLVPGYRSLPIKLRYELQPSDIVLATRFVLSRSFGAWYVLPGLGVFGALLSARALLGQYSFQAMWCAIMAFLLCLSPVVVWVAARRTHRRLPAAQRVVEHEISSDHIRMDNGRVQAAFPWSEIRGFTHDARAVYFWTGPGAVHMIPARAFASAEAMRAVAAFIESRVPRAALRAGHNRRAGCASLAAFCAVLYLLFGLYYDHFMDAANRRALPKDVYGDLYHDQGDGLD